MYLINCTTLEYFRSTVEKCQHDGIYFLGHFLKIDNNTGIGRAYVQVFIPVRMNAVNTFVVHQEELGEYHFSYDKDRQRSVDDVERALTVFRTALGAQWYQDGVLSDRILTFPATKQKEVTNG